MKIDLVLLDEHAPLPAWTLGAVRRCAPAPGALCELIARDAGASDADAWFFWDPALGAPPEVRARDALALPGDIFHSGLELGLAGAPGMIDFVAPTWMLNADPDPEIVATSWRVSFRACLVRRPVLEWAAPDPRFDTLDGMSLEWGHRCVRFGALPRHHPLGLPARAPVVTLEDELRFVRAGFGGKWALWATWRAMCAGYARMEDLADAWLATRGILAARPARPYQAPRGAGGTAPAAVSVLIPTLDRYDHLRTVLGQLRSQTVRPKEIIIVDQTPVNEARPSLAAEFPDLPIVAIALDRAGQCTARNAGLARMRGDGVLFIDDDDEVGPDRIARHVAHLASTGADVSSGVAREPTSGPLPAAFTFARASDVFPTNNTLAMRRALERSGLFDLAYDHGARADGDLGMRAHLSGAVMLLAPEISVLHHHAPRGGLRAHGARVTTYGRSRREIAVRQLPEVTAIYLILRYFSDRQVREALAQSAAGTLSVHGAWWKRAAKAAYGVLMLPHTLWQISRRLHAAREMLARFPQIPRLEGSAR
ncbi:MAG TPA: glycosyltransferase family 2 protein [Gemmatimonadaceae bacterium]|nr:glycosyltransferase family 2 protein [Gemmatimonadaceae bacterium]